MHYGAVFRGLMQPGNFLSVPENTGLILRTDGVRMFKSTKSSLCPVYLAVTNLPPAIRIYLNYILLAGIWSGPSKPEMSTLFEPVLSKIDDLNTKGTCVSTSSGKKQVRAKLLMGIFNLPAKASAANMKRFNNEYGCVFCTDKGTLVSRNRRVYLPNNNHTLRAPESWTDEAIRTSQSVMGVKGVSILSKVILLPECILIDYMHPILEGTFKKKWFYPSNNEKAFYLGLTLLPSQP